MQAALWSAAPRLGDVAANIRRVADGLGDEDLSVWPEMFLTGYHIGDDCQRLAFAPDDARLEPLSAAVEEHGTLLVVGAPLAVRPGIVQNAALCMEPGKPPVWIAKRALPTFTTFQEGLFFQRGGPQPVWRTAKATFGIGVCYDLYFPEFSKRQALDGADVLVNISASPATSRRLFETILPARAIEDTAFMLYSNNVGSQDGIVFWGGAQAYGPRGDLLGRLAPYEEGRLQVEVDLGDLAGARALRPTLRDTEPAWADGLELDA